LVFYRDSQKSPVALRYDGSRLAPDPGFVAPTAQDLMGAVDLDGDGAVDLIGVHGKEFLTWGVPGGGFAPSMAIAPTLSATDYDEVLVDDFDGDGWLDILTAEVALDDMCGLMHHHNRIFLRSGPREFIDTGDRFPAPVAVGQGILVSGPLGPGPLVGAITAIAQCTPPPLFFHRSGVDGDYLPVFEGIPSAIQPYPQVDLLLPNPLTAPMGAVIADIDGDGRLDLAVTGNPDIGFWTGADSYPLPLSHVSTASMRILGPKGRWEIPWSIAFVDLDQDGRPDAVTTHGDDATASTQRTIGKQTTTAHWNAGGGCFVDVSSATAIGRPGQWRSLAVNDLDGDGDADLVVGGLGEAPRFLRNDIQTANHGFGLQLQGSTSNPAGIGALVEVQAAAGGPTQRLVHGAYSQSGIIDVPPLFVGIGAATEAALVRVTWPSGTVQELTGVATGTTHTIVEPPSIAIDPPSRHVAVSAHSPFTLHITPRNPDGSINQKARIGISIVAGPGQGTSLAAPAWDGAAFTTTLQAPGTTGSSVIEVTVDGQPIRIRPRVFWDP
jgi:hypothetical protein